MEPEVTIVDDTLVRRREETITFAEVGGSRRAKEELQEVCWPSVDGALVVSM